MAAILQDNFVDPNGTNLTAHTIAPVNTPSTSWSVLNGGFEIESDNAKLSGFNAATQVAVADAGVTDETFKLTLDIPDGSNVSIGYRMAAGLVFKCSDVNNYWFLVIENDFTTNPSTYYFAIGKLVAGSATVYPLATALTLSNTTQTISVNVSGTSFTCDLSGTTYTPHTGDNFNQAATKCGLLSFSNGANPSTQYPANTPMSDFTVGLGLTVNPASIPGGAVGNPYLQTFTATGGVGAVTFSVSVGALPPGLTLSSAGVLSGVPTTAGTYSFTVLATDSLGQTGNESYSLPIGYATRLFALSPDPRIEPRQRRFDQLVANMLNALVTAGFLIPTGGTTYIVQGMSIGQAVGGGTSGSVLFINSLGQLEEDTGNFAYSAAAATLTVHGLAGTTTNNNASPGNIGQFVSSLVASGRAVALTTATAANVTSISLTAGDWDVEGSINFSAAAATFSALEGGLSATSATLPTDGSEVYSGVVGTLATEVDGITLPRKRFSLGATTTIYLVAIASFSAGSMGVYGGFDSAEGAMIHAKDIPTGGGGKLSVTSDPDTFMLVRITRKEVTHGESETHERRKE